MQYREKYESWLNGSCFDEQTKAELKAIENDESEIKEIHSLLSDGFTGINLSFHQ